MTSLLKQINRAARFPAVLLRLAAIDYAITGKHLTARAGRIVHAKK